MNLNPHNKITTNYFKLIWICWKKCNSISWKTFP